MVTYAVRVSFPDSDTRVKIGMTANLSITTAKQDGVLLVPNVCVGARETVRPARRLLKTIDR